MIFGLLAMWTQYAYLEQLSVGITSLPGSQERGSLTKDAVGILFYQQAGQLLSDAVILSSLECVQACLLLGTYTLPIDASEWHAQTILRQEYGRPASVSNLNMLTTLHLNEKLDKLSREMLYLKLKYCLVRMFVGQVVILPQLRQGDSSGVSESSPKESSTASLTRSVLVFPEHHTQYQFRSGSSSRYYYTMSPAENIPIRQSLRDGPSMLKEMTSGNLDEEIGVSKY
ncbi:hypothetical protein X797_004747 [Metarhizium robertsii]|uniref:Uncharacterized protein n=1 Tax=Metarhizium robertsii TaxID=568076 RepID=A0A0A1UX43_9HYPO|nr:hypothetical protein X797_004747 [Metarhizium robertsii]